jgi:non-heme chloroperoxidase
MRAGAALLAALVAACAREAPRAPVAYADPTSHRVGQVTVAPGVQLETVDWGGSGPVLVLLAGLGNTAHVFDEFAPKLTDSFHVVGITRRGFGASSQPPAADVPTMVADLRAALDSLRLGPVLLVGHSIAGDELTAWAATAGNQCAGLVYLDAAYDRSGLMQFFQSNPMPQPAPPVAADSASDEAYRAWLERAAGVRFTLSEVHQAVVFDSAGRPSRDVTPESLAMRVVGTLPKPDYRPIRCPAVALYATPDSPEHMFSSWATLDSAGRAAATAVYPRWMRIGAASRDQFSRELRGGQVVELPNAHHYVFVTHEADVLRAIRSMRPRS